MSILVKSRLFYKFNVFIFNIAKLLSTFNWLLGEYVDWTCSPCLELI